jgi:simple sugar transport system ATP-binding protein
MTGRSIESVRYRTGTPQSKVLLCARGLSSGNHFRDVDFSLKKGEIIGVTGLSDSGRNELAMSLAGHVPLKKGSLKLDEESIMIGSPAEAISHGIGYVPEDRLSEGLFVEQSIYLNEVPLILDRISAKFGLLNDKKGRMAASDISAKMKLNTEDVDLPVGSLSGGNQQRVLIGRWLSINPRLLILHGPTVGVDIGSKETIFRAIQDMAERGIGIMIISDDLPELLQNCDRILVMNSGRIVEDLRAQDVNEDCIYKSMLGDNQMEFLE